VSVPRFAAFVVAPAVNVRSPESLDINAAIAVKISQVNFKSNSNHARPAEHEGTVAMLKAVEASGRVLACIGACARAA
jgi:hypothetical protein